MKLSSFSVVNYRSITTAWKVQTNNMTVLVGKNNEGKSNILRALTLAMDIMKGYTNASLALNFSPRYLRNHYDWDRDYPISLQEKKPNGCSSVAFNFKLSEEDTMAIRSLTGIRLTEILPVHVSIYKTSVKIDISKSGTSALSDVAKKQKIIEYVCSRINFNFIPAVRTENDVLRVVEAIIDEELSSLETTDEYIDAAKIINRIQQEALDKISSRLISPLQAFLPTVRNVQIHLRKSQRHAMMHRNTEIIIDDGVPTPIQQKGDGIKSLTALAMLNISSRPDSVSVIAIEEPESHLHPESARQLYDTIISLSETHQVVLTTHSPLFVNRINLRENIIVDGGKATSVKKIQDIRAVLGTKVSDNLINAENVLIVEGEDDKISLEKILPHMSEKIEKAIQNGTLIIDYISGAGNLPYKLSFYRNLQCNYHVLLDNDDAGRKAGDDAKAQGLLTVKNLTYTMCSGSPDAEFEDCLEMSKYIDSVYKEFGVNLDTSAFRGNQKWSERVANCFKAQGKQWGDVMKKRVKLCVANALPADPSALNLHKRSSIDALVDALNHLLDK